MSASLPVSGSAPGDAISEFPCAVAGTPLQVLPDTSFDLSLRDLLRHVLLGIPAQNGPSSALLDFCDRCRRQVELGHYAALVSEVLAQRNLTGDDDLLGRAMSGVFRFLAVDFEEALQEVRGLRPVRPDSAILASLEYTLVHRTQGVTTISGLLERDLGLGRIPEAGLAFSHSSIGTEPGVFVRAQFALARSEQLNTDYFRAPVWRRERIEVAEGFSRRARASGQELRLAGETVAEIQSGLRALLEPAVEISEAISREIAAARIAEVPDAQVLSGEWLVRTREPYLLCDLYVGTPHHRMSIYGRLGQSAVDADLVLPVAEPLSVDDAYLCGGDRNYYHWIIDVLPRLQALGARANPRRLALLTTKVDRPFQQQILEACGIAPAQCLPCRYPEVIAAKRLSIPLLGVQNRTFHPSYSPLLGALHQAFGKTVFPAFEIAPWRPGENERRIFVTRGSAGHRRLLNEAEVAARFASEGWTVVEGGKLSVAEQVEAFNGARWIVAVHGAALANTAFCRPGATLIELAFPNWAPPYFERIASVRGVGYTQFRMRVDTPLTRGDSFADAYLDPQLVENLLRCGSPQA